MSNITPGAEAAREAARIAGKFGVRQHTAPETELASPDLTADVILERLSWVHSKDAYAAESRGTELRVAAFVEDARIVVPDAARAVFSWDYDSEGGSRLVFSHYEDSDGEVTEPDDFDSYPDVSDFHVDDLRDAARFGFRPTPDTPGAVLTFSDRPAPNIDRARAELAVGERLERDEDSVAVRYLLTQAMDDGLDPQKVAALTDKQVAKVRRVLARAKDLVRMAVEVDS